MTTPILPLNVRNSNDRIYPTAVLTEALKKLEGRILPGTVGYLDEGRAPTPAETKFFVTDLCIDGTGDYVVGEVRLPNDELIAALESGHAVVRTAGIGEVAADGTVTSFEITSLALIPSSQDAFNPLPSIATRPPASELRW